MKIIDLLNKIAKGEEPPKKIKFKNNIYKWFERADNIFNYKQEYCGRLIDNYFCDDWFTDSKDILNDEVEIIEEEKKIEKLGYKYKNIYGNTSQCKHSEIRLIDKINELIDEINNLKEKINDKI